MRESCFGRANTPFLVVRRCKVVVRLTNEDRVWDNVIVLPMADEISEATLKITNAIGTQKNKERVNSIITSKRSFAVPGFRKCST